MRVLIYGAGVIGCLYGTLFSEAGISVSIYARGKRLEALQKNGLHYLKKEKEKIAKVRIVDKLANTDEYDFIFLTVQEEQLHQALEDLKNNCSHTIVIMVNSLEDYSTWERICGKGRILPAFPGAGGGWKGNILDAQLTPFIIQATSFGELSGKKTKRAHELMELFKMSHIPYEYIRDMHAWQLCHLAMVVPLADAYYVTKGDPKEVYKDKKVMRLSARNLKRNCIKLRKRGIILIPWKMNLFIVVPVWLLSVILQLVYKSKFADRFMYQHAMKAPEEMKALHKEFYGYLQGDQIITTEQQGSCL